MTGRVMRGTVPMLNIIVKPALEKFIRRKVESGDFRSAEEVVSEGLRLLQEQDEQLAAQFRSQINVGWNQAKSGQLSGPDEVRKRLAARKAAWKTGRKQA
ncbi:MAG: type II toxin-antitoxin system ParD family antitoxin [Verrucomicrobiota bacterium]